MYFKDRTEAGIKIAARLIQYKGQHVSVVGLSPGGALVGLQIAEVIHANLMLLLTENINLPGEPIPIGAIASDDTMTYNSLFSVGEIEEFNLDYYTYIEQERMNKIHNLHLIQGKTGEIKREYLKRHIIILTSDGLNSGFSIDVAVNYLKTVSVKRLVVVAPFATAEAYDRMRLLADEAICLNIVDNYMGSDHYYDKNVIPEVSKLLDLGENVSMLWK
jgi:putative phosphoribosyl transferase